MPLLQKTIIKMSKIYFKKKWEGDLYRQGERETLAMELCFGKKCKASTFLDFESFNDVLMTLYEPILKNTN